MDISGINNSAASLGNAQNTQAAGNATATNSTNSASTAAGAASQAKQSQNVAIVQASMQVALKSGNQPLALLYKSAVAGINDELKADLGENAIQNAMSQDNSPEATAQRIVQLSTGFFQAYKQQHPGEDEAASLKNFMQTIRKGFEQGYKEASDILQGLNVLQGDIASGIQKTHDLVLQGFADFEASFSSDKSGQPGASAEPQAA